ncbi:hypothetical protein LQZ21_07785 [Treponema sp. TIM-1]|uniref:hypothetical protein n=1 Tax=Treponema sp. TIM-1 TaxID=2898417 RepID=UPI003980F1BF
MASSFYFLPVWAGPFSIIYLHIIISRLVPKISFFLKIFKKNAKKRQISAPLAKFTQKAPSDAGYHGLIKNLTTKAKKAQKAQKEGRKEGRKEEELRVRREK